jgi:hypothetical protein
VERRKKPVPTHTEEQTTAAQTIDPAAEPEMTQPQAVDETQAAHAAEEPAATAGQEPESAPETPDLKGDVRRLRCDMTISKHVTASIGAGFIPLPVVDFAAVTGVQVDLV